jgi:hypothetical protein
MTLKIAKQINPYISLDITSRRALNDIQPIGKGILSKLK